MARGNRPRARHRWSCTSHLVEAEAGAKVKAEAGAKVKAEAGAKAEA